MTLKFGKHPSASCAVVIIVAILEIVVMITKIVGLLVIINASLGVVKPLQEFLADMLRLLLLLLR